MRARLFALGFVLLASSAFAQPFPGAVKVGNDWVPCDHPIAVAAGKGCGATTPSPAPTPPPLTPPECATLNPYAITGEAFVACFPQPTRPINVWTLEPFSFEVGELYRSAYETDRILVLSITNDPVSRRRIITARFVRSADSLGKLLAFYEDESAWFPLRPGEPR